MRVNSSLDRTVLGRWGLVGVSGLIGFFTLSASTALAEHTRNILITGYWPPTNEMIRPFSQNLTQNPGGWQGGNWEGRGYDVFSYFPEFPGGVGVNPRGEGDFEVDYQDASADFWRVTAELRPVAIISFSRGAAGASWEIESRHRKLPLASWSPDYLAPTRPTIDLPIASETDFNIRQSSLPMANIETAVDAANLGFGAFIDTSSSYGGNFVSEFTGYHSAWYQNMHSDPNDPSWTVAGGHIHVGISTPLAGAITATQITLRELISYVDSVIPAPGVLPLAGAFGLLALRRRRAH
jgi:hypothetical protein